MGAVKPSILVGTHGLSIPPSTPKSSSSSGNDVDTGGSGGAER